MELLLKNSPIISNSKVNFIANYSCFNSPIFRKQKIPHIPSIQVIEIEYQRLFIEIPKTNMCLNHLKMSHSQFAFIKIQNSYIIHLPSC